MIDFQSLEQRYGHVIAFSLLMNVEKYARLNSTELAAIDPDTRLQRALALLDSSEVQALAA